MISMILMRIVIMMMVVVVVSIIGLVLMVVMTNPILIMVAVLEEGTAMTHAVLSTKSRMLETANTTRPTRRREGCSLRYPCLLELILMIRKMDNGQQSPL